jgi:hypothetical protein
MLKILRQLRLRRGDAVTAPQQPFSGAITNHVCGPAGMSDCPAAISGALLATYQALVTANGNATVSSWTKSSALAAQGTTMPAYDAINYAGVGVIGQPAQDWQNRPTWQQVADFPSHRARATTSPGTLPNTTPVAPTPWLPLAALVALLVMLAARALKTRSS